MKLFVLATHRDNDKNAQVKYIAGEFDNYPNAIIFKEAYNQHYNADAVIVDEFTLSNEVCTMTLADYYLEKHGFRMFYHDDRITRTMNLMVMKNGKCVKGSVPLELLSTSEWNTATISFIVGMLAGYLQSQIDNEYDNNEI